MSFYLHLIQVYSWGSSAKRCFKTRKWWYFCVLKEILKRNMWNGCFMFSSVHWFKGWTISSNVSEYKQFCGLMIYIKIAALKVEYVAKFLHRSKLFIFMKALQSIYFCKIFSLLLDSHQMCFWDLKFYVESHKLFTFKHFGTINKSVIMFDFDRTWNNLFTHNP